MPPHATHVASGVDMYGLLVLLSPALAEPIAPTLGGSSDTSVSARAGSAQPDPHAAPTRCIEGGLVYWRLPGVACDAAADLAFLAGINDTSWTWVPVWTALGRADLSPVFLEHPGYAGSTPPSRDRGEPPVPANPLTLARQEAAVLDRLGVDHVVGHSMGGAVALALLKNDAERTAIVLNAVVPEPAGDTHADGLRYLPTGWGGFRGAWFVGKWTAPVILGGSIAPRGEAAADGATTRAARNEIAGETQRDRLIAGFRPRGAKRWQIGVITSLQRGSPWMKGFDDTFYQENLGRIHVVYDLQDKVIDQGSVAARMQRLGVPTYAVATTHGSHATQLTDPVAVANVLRGILPPPVDPADVTASR